MLKVIFSNLINNNSNSINQFNKITNINHSTKILHRISYIISNNKIIPSKINRLHKM